MLFLFLLIDWLFGFSPTTHVTGRIASRTGRDMLQRRWYKLQPVIYILVVLRYQPRMPRTTSDDSYEFGFGRLFMKEVTMARRVVLHDSEY